MSDTDPDLTPRVHQAEVDAAHWVLRAAWVRHPDVPPSADTVRAALAAAKRAQAERR